MSDITVYMLPVGQGAMNLITEYEGTNLVNLVLIDCGEILIGKKDNDKLASAEAKNFVKNMMDKRFTHSGEKVRLDYLLITHRDIDHLSFIEDLFNVYNIALVDDDDNVCVVYKRNGYTDVYTMFDGSKDVMCERTFYNDNTYTIHRSDDEFVIKYENKRFNSKFYAQCSCNKYYSFYINYINNTSYGKNKYINAVSVESEKGKEIWVFEDFTMVNMVAIEGEILDHYTYMLNFFFELFDTYCTAFISKDEIIGLFDFLEADSYKSYNDIREDIGKSRQKIKAPITNCFVGGLIGQAEETVELLHILSQNYKDGFISNADIFEFNNPNITLEIIHYVKIEQMAKFFKSIDSPNNATSAVSLLYNSTGEFKVLFTGDATQHTFGMIEKQNTVGMLNDAIWTAPHHGSTSSLKGVGGSVPLDKLLEKISVKSVVISAGYQNKFGHPHGGFIAKFKRYFVYRAVTLPIGSHDICYNRNDTKRGDWVCQATDYPILTTLTKDRFVAHIFEFSTQTYKVDYRSNFFSTVTQSYECIPQDDSVHHPAGSPRPLDDVAVAENEKTKIADADISLKKLFIIR